MTQSATFRPIHLWPRTETRPRRRSVFKSPYSKTLDLLFREIEYLGGRNIVIQIDVQERELRNDGWPRSDARPMSPRVLLSLESKHGPLAYPCDRFDRWQDNLRAIALALEALRKVDRYGVTTHGEQYTGWRALPASVNGDGFESVGEAAEFIAQHSDEDAVQIGGLLTVFRCAYRQAARKLHPDVNNGQDADFKKLQKAREMIVAMFTTETTWRGTK